MLVHQQHSLVSHVRKKYDHVGKALFEDSNAWVALVEIFTDALNDPKLSNTCLVIDALDECIVDLPKLLQFLARQSVSSRVKWIVSSRNWPEIEEMLEGPGCKAKLSLELNAHAVAVAVNIFIEQRVSLLSQQKKYDAQIQDAVLDHLKSNANGTFLWVALVCQSLEQTSRRHVLRKLKVFPPGLDSLYTRMMEQINKSDDAYLCKQMLALSAIVYHPVTIHELVVLVEQLEDMDDDLEAVKEIISLCGSFLTLRENTIYFVHQSAKEFLFAKAYEEIYPDGSEEAHRIVFLRSIKLLSETLKRNMYSIEAIGCSIKDVKTPDPDPLTAARYSCIYWIDHLCDSFSPRGFPASSTSWKQDSEVIYVFLSERYLYWLEALSLCRSLPTCLVSMTKLCQVVVQGRDSAATLTELVRDAYRFVHSHKRVIENCPLQAYASALFFSPRQSLIRKMFQHEEPTWITVKPAVDENWNPCLQTLEEHRKPVNSVAISCESTRLASASMDTTVKIWDIRSGTCIKTLEGHCTSVYSVAFSHDSTQLASAGFDEIKIWDISSGVCLRTFIGQNSNANLVAFSQDSTRLVSASQGGRHMMFKSTLNNDNQVAFSHDLTRLASSYRGTIKIWDTESGECLQTLASHDDYTNSDTFSHDSTRPKSSYRSPIQIWDTRSGECIQALGSRGGHVNSVAFSHDSTWLASTAMDKIVKIWDVSSGVCQMKLQVDDGHIRSAVFSHDSTRLASVFVGSIIKVWDTRSGVCVQTFEGQIGFIKMVAFSHDSTWLASASSNGIIRIWDASSDTGPENVKEHNDSVMKIATSPDGALLASILADGIVKIWDANRDRRLTLIGHKERVISVSFFHDSTQLVTVAINMIIKFWDMSSGVCLRTFQSNAIYLPTLSNDSTKLASASRNGTIKIWDTRSSACLQTFKGHGDHVNSIAFSHDSTRLASAANDFTVKIWDVSTGVCILTLNGNDKIKILSFDPTGTCLRTSEGAITTTLLPLSTTIGAAELSKPPIQGRGIGINRAWITYKNQNVLWLPSEYRSSISSVASESARVWTLASKMRVYTIHPKYFEASVGG